MKASLQQQPMYCSRDHNYPSKFLETLPQAEQERCNTMEGLFTTLNNKFKPQDNETIKTLQFHKLFRQGNANAEEWMGRLRLTAVQYSYKDTDTQLKEQFIYWLNDNGMLVQMIRELT